MARGVSAQYTLQYSVVVHILRVNILKSGSLLAGFDV